MVKGNRKFVSNLIKAGHLSLPFVLTMLIYGIIFAVNGLYPFGKAAISWGDMNQQFIPLFCELKDVLAGKSSLFMSYANAGGMNFYGVWLYYCSSPLSLLVIFVEKADMSKFMNVLVVLKASLASLTAYIYLQKKCNGEFRIINIALSLFYGFCGYVMMFYQIISWLDCMYVFPILLLGIEKVERGESPILYTVMLSYNMLCSYYITYMAVIYVLIRFGVGFIYGKRSKKAVYNFIIGSFLAALVSAIVYLPVFIQYGDSARTFSLVESLKYSNALARLNTTLLVILSMVSVLPFIFLKAESSDAKINRVMFILTLLPMFVEPINKMWQTGSYMCFPTRYAFITLFSLIAYVGECLNKDNPSKCKIWVKCIVYGAIAGLLVLVISLYNAAITLEFEVLAKYSSSLWGSDESFNALLKIYLIVLGVGIILFILYKFKLLGRVVLGVAFMALAVSDAFFSGKIYMKNPSHITENYESIMKLSDLIDDDDGFYRVNSDYKMFSGSDGIGVNAVGAMGYNNLSHFTSLTSDSYMNAVKQLGYSSYWLEIGDYGGTRFSNAFLLNKYTFYKGKKSNYALSTDKFYAIKNDVMKLGVITEGELIAEFSGERSEIAEELYTALTGKTGLIEKYKVPYEGLKGVEYTYEDGIHRLRSTGTAKGTVTYSITVDGKRALYFDCFDLYTNDLKQHINESFNITVNGKSVRQNYPAQNRNGIVFLGEFSDETVTVKLTLNKNFYGRSFGVFSEDLNAASEAISSLTYADIKVKGNKMKGSVTAKSGDELVLALPFDKGYTFRVNGKSVKATKVLTDFIAIPLSEGENVITAHFMPKGFVLGLICTIIGAVLIVLYVAFGKKIVYNYDKLNNRVYKASCVAGLILSAATFTAIYILPLILTIL